MLILNHNNNLDFELPFSDGAFDEYIRPIDLIDSEKELVISLMKGASEAELEDLGLQETNPELYAKLEDIYEKMALEAEEKHWLWVGFRDGAFEYDVEELMAYCEENCDFVYEGSLDDFDAEDEYLDAKQEEFDEWLEDYLITLGDVEFKEFMYTHLNASVDMEPHDYDAGHLLDGASPLTAEETQAVEARYFEYIEEIKEQGCPKEILEGLLGKTLYDYICEYQYCYSWDEWECLIKMEFEGFYNIFGPSAWYYIPDQEKLKAAIE